MKGPRGQREGELEPEAIAALRAFRAADEMPGAAQARVWARLAEATAEPEVWPQEHVRKGRSEWAWAAVVVAAAAALLLASRAGVLGPLVGVRGGEAASYAENAGPATVTAATAAERAGSAGAGESVSPDMAVGTDVSEDMVAETAGARAAIGASEPRVGGAEARVRGDAGHAGAKAGGDGSQAGAKAGGSAGPAGAKASGEAGHAGGKSGGSAGQAPAEHAGAEAAGEASSLAQEAELLARAQAAIQGGRAEEALSRLAEYARRFPGGTLHEEHDALRALALCAAGRVIEGRGEARAFLASRGGSALAERVRRGCLEE